MKNLVLCDVDQCDGDILATFDLNGITIDLISTAHGFDIDSIYVLDGGYGYIDVFDFKKQYPNALQLMKSMVDSELLK